MHAFLAEIVRRFAPRTYLELNTQQGEAVRFFSQHVPSMHCVAIGEQYEYNFPLRLPIRLIRTRPEEAAATLAIKRDFVPYGVELCFIDNMHHFDETLRLLAAYSRWFGPRTIVVVDNLLPNAPEEADRARRPGFWMGDVWKALPALREWRKDVQALAVDDGATGLLLLSGFDGMPWEPPPEALVKRWVGVPYTTRDETRAWLEAVSPEDAQTSPFWRRLREGYVRALRVGDVAALPAVAAFDRSAPAPQYRERTPDEARTVLRRPPEFIDDYAGQGWAAAVGVEQRVPVGHDATLYLRDARVFGHRSIASADGLLFNDQRLYGGPAEALVNRLLTGADSHAREGTDFIAGAEPGVLLSRLAARPTVQIDEPVLCLGSFEPYNFASWLFRFLPKWVTARAEGLESLRVLVPVEKPWQRELLLAAGLSPKQIIPQDFRMVYQCREAFVPMLRSQNGYLDAETLAFFQEMLARQGIVQRPERLLYVSRLSQGIRHPNYRRFENELALIEGLQARGFQVIEPEALPLADQWRAFAGARMVVGPSGAGMFQTYFSPPEAFVIDIEALHYWLPCHCNVFASPGHRYGLILGQADAADPTPIQKRWSLDVDMTLMRVDDVLTEV